MYVSSNEKKTFDVILPHLCSFTQLTQCILFSVIFLLEKNKNDNKGTSSFLFSSPWTNMVNAFYVSLLLAKKNTFCMDNSNAGQEGGVQLWVLMLLDASTIKLSLLPTKTKQDDDTYYIYKCAFLAIPRRTETLWMDTTVRRFPFVGEWLWLWKSLTWSMYLSQLHTYMVI